MLHSGSGHTQEVSQLCSVLFFRAPVQSAPQSHTERLDTSAQVNCSWCSHHIWTKTIYFGLIWKANTLRLWSRDLDLPERQISFSCNYYNLLCALDMTLRLGSNLIDHFLIFAFPVCWISSALICKPKAVTDPNYSLNRGFSQYKRNSYMTLVTR